MRQLIKLSFITLAVGAFMAGPIQAMPVVTDSDVKLDISGMVGVTEGYFTAHEQNGEAPPTIFATTVEARITLTAGTDTLTVMIADWIREDDGELQYQGTMAGSTPRQFGQAIWRPTDNLRIDMGSVVYLPWSDRSLHWEVFHGVGPVHINGVYRGYPEDSPVLDITYITGGGIDVGLAIMSQGQVTGATNSMTPDDTGYAQVGQTFVFHLVYAVEGMHVKVSQYAETITMTGDGWANTDDATNSLTVVDFKFQYDDGGSFVKADYLSATGDSFATDEVTIAIHVSHYLGDPQVYVEYETTTALGGNEDVDATYTRVGYDIPVAAGGSVRVEYEANDNGDSVASTINLALFQSF